MTRRSLILFCQNALGSNVWGMGLRGGVVMETKNEGGVLRLNLVGLQPEFPAVHFCSYRTQLLLIDM